MDSSTTGLIRMFDAAADGTIKASQRLARGFNSALAERSAQADSLLCVGLDPQPARLPPHLGGGSQAIEAFCRAIVDATADQVCAFKPQIAHFSAQRAEAVLERLIDYIHQRYPTIPVILDAKRGDIGDTARLYAAEAFDRYQADAVTVNPYLGQDSIAPFLRYPGRGVFLLCRTSNAGAADLQALPCPREPLFAHVAKLAASAWNVDGELGLVVGATWPAEIATVRSLAPSLPLLIPGIGAQGGDISAVVAAGLDDTGAGIVVSSSRAILYACDDRQFEDAARAAAMRTRAEINSARDGRVVLT